LFLKKMTDTTTVKICTWLADENLHEMPETLDSDIILKKNLPPEVAVFEINGPFFYTVSNLLNEEMRQLPDKPKFFILRMHKCPIIDATGMRAFKEFYYKCSSSGITFLISGLNQKVEKALNKSGVIDLIGREHTFRHLDDAIAYTRLQQP